MAERKKNTDGSQPGGVELTSFWNEKLHGNVVTGDITTGPSSSVEPVIEYQGMLEVQEDCLDMENSCKEKMMFINFCVSFPLN